MVIDFVQKGGPLLWLILLCSVLAGAIFLERFTYYHRVTIRVGEFLRGLMTLVSHQRYAEAMRECEGTPGPVPRVIHAALLRPAAPRAELRDIVQEAGQLEVPRLERRLAMLATIAYISPLLGLLGTVVGLIQAFVQVSAQSGFASSTELAGGIYQSLLCTAAGLAVCIPSVVGYGYLSSRVNALLHDMERAGIEIVNLLGDAQRPADVIAFTPAGSAPARGYQVE